jgi:hypothetical protein
VDPAGVLRVDVSGEEADDGSFPVGDGAEDREDIEGSGLEREAVDIDRRDPEGADGVGTRQAAVVFWSCVLLQVVI